MAFYTMTVVQRVDEQGKPLPADGCSSGNVVKEHTVWDERSVEELRAAYQTDGSLTTNRLGPQHSPGRPYEWRGEISVFTPFLVSIESDVKADVKQPRGPVDYLDRSAAR